MGEGFGVRWWGRRGAGVIVVCCITGFEKFDEEVHTCLFRLDSTRVGLQKREVVR